MAQPVQNTKIKEPVNSPQKLYLITMFLGATIMGGTALFAKLIQLDVVSITFWRSVVAISVIFIIYRLKKDRTPLFKDKKVFGMVFLTGLALGAHWLTYFHSIQVSTVAVGAISMHTYPIFTVLLEPLIHKSKLHTRDILLAVAVFTGCFILSFDSSSAGSTQAGVIWGVISAILFAIRNVISRFFVQGYGALAVMIIQLSGVLAITALSTPLLNPIETDLPVSQIGLLVLLGVVFTAVSHGLIVFSLKQLSAKSVSIISCLQPIYATIFAYLILSEVPGWNVLVGGSVVLAAVMFEMYLLRK